MSNSNHNQQPLPSQKRALEQQRSHNILAWNVKSRADSTNNHNINDLARGKPLQNANGVGTYNITGAAGSSIAPFATSNNVLHSDLSKQETALSQLSFEKEKLQRELFKLPENPRTLTERKKKHKIENEMQSLEDEITQLKRFIKQHSKA